VGRVNTEKMKQAVLEKSHQLLFYALLDDLTDLTRVLYGTPDGMRFRPKNRVSTSLILRLQRRYKEAEQQIETFTERPESAEMKPQIRVAKRKGKP
jgi:hypothetical protein